MPRSPLAVRLSKFMIDLERRLGEGRNAITVSKIMSNLRTVHARVNGVIAPFDSLSFVEDPDKVADAMKDYTIRSYKTYISSIISALTVLGGAEILTERYRKIHSELKETVDTQDDSHAPTEKQETRMIPLTKLVEARDRMKKIVDSYNGTPNKKQYQYVQSYMLLCIVTMCDTVFRNQDLCNMVVRSNWEKDPPATQNYFLWKFNLMEMYVYKTASTYGRQVISLSSELTEILSDCLAMRPACYGPEEDSPFFINQNGQPLTTGGGIQRLYERAGLDLCPTIVRNIIATERSGDAVEAVERVQQNAKNFGHSVKQHMRYVRKTLESTKKSMVAPPS